MFILKLAKALMSLGAPCHRIESQLNATARILSIDGQFIHLPSVVIASFGDPDTNVSDTHFVKADGGLALGKLHKVHLVYRQVVHGDLSVDEGVDGLTKIMREPDLYNIWIRIAIAFATGALIAPLAFSGSFIDMWISGTLSALLAFLQLYVAANNALYSNIFE